MRLKILEKSYYNRGASVVATFLIIINLNTTTAQNRSQSTYFTTSIEVPHIKPEQKVIHDTVGRFIVKYNEQTVGADFVAYRLCKSDINGHIKRKNRFFSDQRVIKMGLPYAKNSDYSASGYDRGHLLPSADRQSDQATNDATFSLLNCLPQTPQLNRGTWKKLEESLRNQLSVYDTLYIVTGIVVSDTAITRVIGAGAIRVPHSFFKACVGVKKGIYSAQAYVMPNSSKLDPNYMTYRTTIDQVELLTGLDLFVNLEDSVENKIEQM